jgi:hypothetical protein
MLLLALKRKYLGLVAGLAMLVDQLDYPNLAPTTSSEL